MILRILQVAIILAWVLATGLLVQKTYFPDQSFYPRVDPRYVGELFFGDQESTDVAVVQDRRVLGRFSVQPRSIRPAPLVKADFQAGDREIFFNGILSSVGGMEALGQMFLNGSFYTDEAFALRGVRLQVRLPGYNVSGQVYARVDVPSLAYELVQNGEVILDSKDRIKTTALMERMEVMAEALGMALPEIPDEIELAPLVAMLQPVIECRHGQFRMLAKRYDGYILSVRLQGEDGLKLYFSELGELLRIDGIPGLEVVAEAFIPQDMREDPVDVP